MFTAKDVEVGSGVRYQRAGVSEKVTITEVVLNSNGDSLTLKTSNELEEIGVSKRLSLKTVVGEGKKMSGWDVTARYLINLIVSATGKSIVDSKAVLTASSIDELIKNLAKTLVGKSFRGLFTSKEYAPGKFAIELYASEPVGGNRLIYDVNNTTHNNRLPVVPSPSNDGLPF